MKMCVSIKLFLLLFIATPCTTFSTKTHVYFLPKDKEAVAELLPAFMDKAQKEILVASYFLTDNSFLDKLIELKNRGIAVHVITDITSHRIKRVLDKLIAADIVPVASVQLLMHNKFLERDGSDVWTGSANMTPTALSEAQNYENVVTISSPKIAQKYKTTFFEMESEILHSYVEWLQGKWTAPKLPIAGHILPMLLPILYQKNESFKELVRNNFNPKEIADLLTPPHPVADHSEQESKGADAVTLATAVCPEPGTSAAQVTLNAASPAQQAMLRKRDVDPADLSYKEAYLAIGYLLQEEENTKRTRTE